MRNGSDRGFRQPNDSAETTEFRTNVVRDLRQIADRVNHNTAEQENQIGILSNDVRYLSQRVSDIGKTIENDRRLSDAIVYNINLDTRAGVLYADQASDSNKCVINPDTGNISLPVTSISPVFYRQNPVSGEIFIHDSFEANIQNINEPEFPAVNQGDIASAFSGSDRSFWIRRAEYPVDSSVAEISSELVIRVSPADSGGRLNHIMLRPYPLGTMDITGIWIKANNSSSFRLLEQFPHVRSGSELIPIPIENVTEHEFFFPEKNFVEIKIGIKQRNFRIEDNRKIFEYGFEEVTGELVDYTRANSNYSSDLKENNHIAWKVEAPEGREFNSITFFDTDPNPQGERQGDINQAHIVYYITKEVSIDDPQKIYWNSFDYTNPQSGSHIDVNDDPNSSRGTCPTDSIVIISFSIV